MMQSRGHRALLVSHICAWLVFALASARCWTITSSQLPAGCRRWAERHRCCDSMHLACCSPWYAVSTCTPGC